MRSHAQEREVVVNANGPALPATFAAPPAAGGAILLVHVADSRQTPCNRYIASVLQQAGFATLQLDLLKPEEAPQGDECLVNRLVGAAEWLAAEPAHSDLPIGVLATGRAAALALIAATRAPDTVHAVVSCGGRPDLAGDSLSYITCPTLLIVGGADTSAVSLNWRAFEKLVITNKQMYAVLGTGSRFDEAGAIEQVAEAARDWFAQHLIHVPETAAVGTLEVLVGAAT